MKSNPGRNISSGSLKTEERCNGSATSHCSSSGPFVEGPIGADEKLIRDTKKYGNWEGQQPLAHGAQERRLVTFERTLSNEIGLDASALTIMAQCIP